MGLAWLQLDVCSEVPLFLKDFEALTGFDGICFFSSSITADSWSSLLTGHTREDFLELAPRASPPFL